MEIKFLSALIVIAIITYMVGSLLGSRIVYINRTIEAEPLVIVKTDSNLTFAQISVPAINLAGEGVITNISVQATPGSGQALTNIERILFWVDTQHSIRTARTVAQNITGLDLSKYDLTYTITADASVIEGPSAGAAITLVTIAALQNKSLANDTMITGTINEDGSIGMAGAITEKAKAAKAAGANTFLIPIGTARVTGTEKEKVCTEINGTEYCEIKYVPKKAELGEEIGISMIEVGNIKEALEYFSL